MYVFVCMYIIECKYVTYYHWIVMSQFQQKPQLTLGSGEWLLHCRYGCVTNALSDSQTQWCSFMSKRTVTMWLAEDHIPKSRWLTRTLWVSSTSAAAVNAKGDGKDTMAPQGTDSCNKCLKYFILAPFKGLEDTMTLLKNCKRDQKHSGINWVWYLINTTLLPS